MNSQLQLSEDLKEEARKQGFFPVGIASIPGSKRLRMRTETLERWLENGNHADMKWMEAPRRKSVETILEGVSSLLAVGLNYYVDKEKDSNALSIARYAWGNDYHKIMKKRLTRVGRWLEEKRPNCQWKICVDSSPVLDKAWAEEAGLGWIGKNSNLINSINGSWMVIGHLLCTERLSPDKPAIANCDKCQICIDQCPTQAITEPFVVDSRRCLAYHTIENRNSELPSFISSAMGSWVAGCDICQEICPWNKKPITSSTDPDVQPKDWILTLTKDKALNFTDNEWKEKLKGSALKRIKPNMWQRNIKAARIPKDKNSVLK
mgnify:CR=1 FL=1